MILIYKRFENESDDELIYRITGEKDKIGSWVKVAEILNDLLGKNYTESKYRKQRQSFDKMLSTYQSKVFTSNNAIKDLEIKKEELRKERIKLQTLNIEKNRIEKNEARKELYYEYIGSMVNTLPLPNFKSINSYHKNKCNYLLAISDIHYGAKFKSVNNEYSPDIAKERLELLLSNTICFVKNKKINRLSVVCLGDCIQGILRINDLKINDSSIVKATVDISRIIAMFINELSSYCYIDYYHVPSANHTQTRNLGTKASELADEDLEYIISNYIYDLTKNNSRIKVHLNDENSQYININISNCNILCGHGHTVKNINTALRDLSILHMNQIDYLLLGHFHGDKNFSVNESINHDCEVIIAPSIVGSDPYSDSILKGSKSSAKIYGFDEKNGFTEQYKFILN